MQRRLCTVSKAGSTICVIPCLHNDVAQTGNNDTTNISNIRPLTCQQQEKNQLLRCPGTKESESIQKETKPKPNQPTSHPNKKTFSQSMQEDSMINLCGTALLWLGTLALHLLEELSEHLALSGKKKLKKAE